MSRYLADRRRVLTYPLGPDDPNLPDELSDTAMAMRAYRDAQHDPPTADQVARVAQIMRPYAREQT